MANWAFVEDNQIKELHDLLPKSWRNISGLRMSENDLEFLKSLGWYQVIKQYDQYDNNLFQEVGISHIFDNEQVKETIELSERKFEPSISIETTKFDLMIQLREERNKRLLETDWTQLTDVVSMMNETNIANWKKYRQDLRNLPAKYDTDDNFKDISQIEWPEINNV
jgi:hypothetical protein